MLWVAKELNIRVQKNRRQQFEGGRSRGVTRRSRKAPRKAEGALMGGVSAAHSGLLETRRQGRCLARLGPGARRDALHWAAYP